METRSKGAILFGVSMIACAAMASAQGPMTPPQSGAGSEPARVEPLSSAERAVIAAEQEEARRAREKRINAECEAIERGEPSRAAWAKEWAGTYYTGDGLGMNVVIMIAPESGVTYTWRGCMGLYDSAHGEIAETFDDGVRVPLTFGDKDDTMGYMSERLYFMRWGDHRYLVPESKMLDVVSAFNQGGFSREHLGVPRKRKLGERSWEGSRGVPPGVPELPPAYAALILKEPLTLRVIDVTTTPLGMSRQGTPLTQTLLTFDAGRVKGVYEGMKFTHGDFHCPGFVTVIEVGDTTCRAEYMDVLADCGLPKVGDAITLPGVARE